jgi:glycosyltransferase involved in cell wall biosynthesis
MPSEPLVTVISAAYNRAPILRYAIDSVINQSWQNWQYIVVGDCCTDNTEELVTAYVDPRIEFHNLESNSGGQSAPHNYALSLARGEFIFYLNQDDFYFPEHIANSVAFLQHSQADMIWCPVALPLPENRNSPQNQPMILDGVSKNGKYDPATFIISSSWAMRSNAPARIGPWKSGSETPISPSQEFIFRAAQKGIDIQFQPEVSVLCVHAGGRPLAYLEDEETEYKTYYDLIYNQENGLQQLLQRIALTQAQRALVVDHSAFAGLKYHIDSIVRGLLLKMGYHPASLQYFFKYRKYGGFLNWHRNYVLKLPLLKNRKSLRAGDPDNDHFFGTGWSGAEKTQRWSVGSKAKIFLRTQDSTKQRKLIVRGGPAVKQTVRFEIEGQEAFSYTYTKDEEKVEIPLKVGIEQVSLTLFLQETVAPSSLNPLSPDSRELGFMLREIRIHQRR